MSGCNYATQTLLAEAEAKRAKPFVRQKRLTDTQSAFLAEHDLKHDPPFASSVDRETCSRCGRAVLIRRDGTVYGSASEQGCS